MSTKTRLHILEKQLKEVGEEEGTTYAVGWDVDLIDVMRGTTLIKQIPKNSREGRHLIHENKVELPEVIMDI